MTHIVDTLIEERAERLREHPWLWSWVQQYLYPVFGYREAVALVDLVQTMGGYEVLEHISNMLDMRVSVEGVEHIPKEGRAVVMPNHPAGIADGIAVFDADGLARKRHVAKAKCVRGLTAEPSTLDLSGNGLTDDCLKHLSALASLELLDLSDTSVSAAAIAEFLSVHPGVDIKTQSDSEEKINPFTGERID